MLMFDVLLRYPSMTLSLILIILLARNAWSHQTARLCILLLITSVASSIHTSPETLKFPNTIHIIALFVSIPGMGLRWWFARSLLEDDFKIKWFEWVVMIICCLFKLGWSLQGIGIMPPAHSLRYWGSYGINFLLMGHITWLAVSGLRHDMVESRRRLRFWFIIFVGVSGCINLVFEMICYSSKIESLFGHLISLPILIFIFFWMVNLNPKLNDFLPHKTHKNIDEALPPKYAFAHQHLIQLLEKDQIFTDYELNINTLAQQVGIPEHQLRNLVNQVMGYRNFPSLLNHYRIKHAKSLLSNIENSRMPILTIAMDSGFQTVSTFNRAFKAIEKETPSDYRMRQMNK